MTKYLILILALLIPSTASAGQAAKRMMMVMGNTCSAQTGTVNNLNGVTQFLDGGDTGTATPSTYKLCSGTASVDATCDGTLGGAATVYLDINSGETVRSLSCANGEAQKTQTLSAPVSGSYTARVYSFGAGYAAATNFVFPVAQ